jgi:Ca2+-transporting ATPase
VYLYPGYSISVDGVLAESKGLLVDESTITGESEFIVKNSEENCFLLGGSLVKEGDGRMLVCAVGKNSNLMSC